MRSLTTARRLRRTDARRHCHSSTFRPTSLQYFAPWIASTASSTAFLQTIHSSNVQLLTDAGHDRTSQKPSDDLYKTFKDSFPSFKQEASSGDQHDENNGPTLTEALDIARYESVLSLLKISARPQSHVRRAAELAQQSMIGCSV